MNELVCKQGDVIFKEGERDGSMYQLLSGGASVYAKYGEADEKFLFERRVGDYFGEMAVLANRDRSATAVSLENGTTLNQFMKTTSVFSLRRIQPW